MKWRCTVLCFTLVGFGCGESTERLAEYELGGATMGTRFNIKLVAPDEAMDRINGRKLEKTVAGFS